MMRPLLALLALLLVAAPAEAQQRVRTPKARLPDTGFVTVPLQVTSIPVVTVKVNGTELRLGVDTGCQGAGVLTPKALEKAGMEVAMTLPTMGNTGRSEMEYALVDTLEMAGGAWNDFHIAVLPLEGTDLDGLVGAEVLFAQPFYMDLADKAMVLGKVPDVSGAREVSCYSRGGHVNLNLEIDGRKVPMLIDSGASLSYVTAMKYRGKVAFRGYSPVATVRGVSLQKLEVCQPGSIAINGIPLRGVTLHRSPDHNILGNDFLRAHPLAVDRASRRLWLFEPLRTPGAKPAAAGPVAEPAR